MINKTALVPENYAACTFDIITFCSLE